MKKSKYKWLRKLTEWFRDVDKKTLIVTIAISVIFIVVWILFFMNLYDVAYTYRSFMEESFTYQSDKASSDISSLIDENVKSTVNLATAIGRYDKDNENIPGMLTSAITSLSAENAVILDIDGGVLFNDGKYTKELNVQPLFDNINPALKHSFINNESYFLTDKDSFICAVPIRRADKIDSYLVTITAYDTVFVQSDVRDNVDHAEIMLDNNGKIVESISMEGFSKVTSDVVFFDELEKEIPEDRFNAMVADYNESINSGKPGSFSTEISGGNTLFCYHPLGRTNGWAIINVYTEGNVKAMVRDITVKLIITFAVIILLMFIAGSLVAGHLRGERKKISNLEYLDPLTGVYNKKAFLMETKKLLKENSHLPYFLMCFDIVNFKMINEAYGHERADRLIVAIADACKEAFGSNEVYARLNADVFVALSIDDGEGEERTAFIERFVNDRAKQEYINNQIKCKRGVYIISDYDESVDSMIDKANIARKYLDSDSNKYLCVYSDDIMKDARKTQLIESQMSQALKSGEFKPYLQAKYNMQKNVVSGAEALVRWIKEDGTVIPPNDFIPLFERNGFIEKLDFYILEEICKYIRRMIDEDREVYTISVNQSRYLMNDPNYVNKVKDILLKYQIPVGLIELELTETVFLYERDRMIKMMSDLKAINVNLSIDDFGSGYSSFNILKDVPFNVLKIDREFLTESVHTEKGKWILKEIVEMAHGLGMSVICEGVETREQADLLLSLDCHYAQGFFYARPVPVDDFIRKYNILKKSGGAQSE